MEDFMFVHSELGQSDLPFEMFSNGETFKEDYLQLLKNHIDNFTDLGDNWDGYRGVALLETVATKAKSFISMLNGSLIDGISGMYPNPHGTITIEWDNKTDEMLSLEIGENNYSYFIETKNNGPKFFNGQDLPTLEAFSSHLGEIFSNELPRICLFSA